MSGSKRNGNTSRARPLEAGMSVGQRSRFTPPPARRLTPPQRRKAGRPSSLTPARRARVERALTALQGNRHKVVAAELGVSLGTYRNWVAEVKRELIAAQRAKRGLQ